MGPVREAERETRVEIDHNVKYVVEGSTLDMIYSTGFTTLRWSVKGRKLTLSWVKTTEPPYACEHDLLTQSQRK